MILRVELSRRWRRPGTCPDRNLISQKEGSWGNGVTRGELWNLQDMTLIISASRKRRQKRLSAISHAQSVVVHDAYLISKF